MIWRTIGIPVIVYANVRRRHVIQYSQRHKFVNNTGLWIVYSNHTHVNRPALSTGNNTLLAESYLSRALVSRIDAVSKLLIIESVTSWIDVVDSTRAVVWVTATGPQSQAHGKGARGKGTAGKMHDERSVVDVQRWVSLYSTNSALHFLIGVIQ